jgi:phosphate transport system protein
MTGLGRPLMERLFDEELTSLKHKLLDMAALAEETISDAVVGLRERREDLLQEVFRDEERINALDIDIDDICHRLLVLRQPVAADMRFIVSANRIGGDLERIGDLSVNIAEQALTLIKQPPVKPLIDIPEMARAAQAMVRDVIDAFVRGDESLARDACARDERVDQLNDQVFRELLTITMADPTTIPRAIALILIARNLERIADHATNIGESVIYLLKGQVIKHHRDRHSGGRGGSAAAY